MPTLAAMGEHRLVAFNTATASANKIHDDDVARAYGFGGGLVPGVDVYAYMTHPAAEAWGLDWLERGTMQARFLAPVYDGDGVTVTTTSDDDGLRLEVRNGAGTLCATGEATLPATSTEPPPLSRWPAVGPASDPPPAGPDTLAAGTPLALPAHGFHADQAPAYLADVCETLPLYTGTGVAHPGWLLRDANYVLSSNVVLGPWIHVESHTRHHGLVHDGERVQARAMVAREWERKGHRIVELDVGLVAEAARLVAHVTHTAIYRPRAPSPTG
jgi:acyl dehydratase